MGSDDFIAMNREYVFNTYGRIPIMLVEGTGCKVVDSNGREYLDFIAGLAACPLGHGHLGIAETLYNQARRLIHVSNLFHIEPQIQLAKILTENSFADKAFFCNSGAEANEGAIKLARKFFHDRGEHDRYHVITLDGSFHGRTLATLAATGQTKYRKGFEPPVEGFVHVPFGDIRALETAISAQTAAVLIEPIQGEGGVNVPPEGYLREVRDLCDGAGCLLMLDEVQTGMGRTGKLFAYENFGIQPDVMTLAKGIAGGVPMGATLATDKVAQSFVPGTHASTFGGNPLAASAGLFVANEILSEGFLARVKATGDYLRSQLETLASKHEIIREVRGIGLMQAIDLKMPGADLVATLRDQGLLVNCTADTVLRFLPPLIVTKEEIDSLTAALDKTLTKTGGA
ncbi:MAG: aspartate aminotransferase family protein [Desulfomonile tiedjei]|uniref:Acetylornithine aminotransferase n=1 Tax=Desulfomonile tiedjei TaxID=2358 RepID=A0A9D6V5Q5_9BACT|nr:aspartate aminotransferase family protein [Desulfomonile tiedjei]